MTDRERDIVTQIELLRQEVAAGLEKICREIETGFAALQDQRDQGVVFRRGIAAFITELLATLARIERKLDGR